VSWPLVSLDDVSVHIRNGASIKQSSDMAGLPITRIETIANREINLDKCGYADVGGNEFLGHRLGSGDILISHINSEKHLGKCAIYEGFRDDIIHGMNLLCLRPKQEIVFPRFLFHYLSSSVFLQMIPAITKKSVNQASFTVTAFKFLKIPLPPLPEQQRIAAILDKADAIRRKRQQAIQLADDFLRAVFLDMFGDPVTNPKGWYTDSLLSHGSFKNGLNYGRGDSGVSIKCLGVGDFKALKSISDMSTLSTLELNSLPSHDYLLKDGDLVFVRSNGNKALVGRCITIYTNEEQVTFSGFCIRYRVSSHEILPEYLNYLFRTPSMKKSMLQGGQGANIQNINQKILSEISIPIPPSKMQKQFINIVKRFDKTLNKNTNSEYYTAQIFDSLSQQAFSGKL